MNSAVLAFTRSQLVIFRQLVTEIAWDRQEMLGLQDLKRVLAEVQPDQPHQFAPGAIAAADEAFALAAATDLPRRLGPEAEEDYRHLKAVIAAAAVD